MLLNVECDKPVLDELVGAFRFSDAVLRHLVINMNEAVTEASPMARTSDEERPASEDEDVSDEPRVGQSAAS